MGEIWKDIPNYEGFYEVSNKGRVRSLDRKFVRSNGRKATYKSRILKCSPSPVGYPVASLSKQGKISICYVHALVLLAFVGPRPKNYECRHLDDIKTNNHLDNLCWGTAQENADDRIKNETVPRGEQHYNAKLSDQDIRNIRKDKRIRREIAKDYGVTRECINNIIWRNIWKHIE